MYRHPYLRRTAFFERSRQGLDYCRIRHVAARDHERSQREAAKGKQTGRTQEIQRLIARSLRAACDLSALGENTITIDCDVIQADGGTRTAAITGGCVALADAIQHLINIKRIKTNPFKQWLPLFQ